MRTKLFLSFLAIVCLTGCSLTLPWSKSKPDGGVSKPGTVGQVGAAATAANSAQGALDNGKKDEAEMVQKTLEKTKSNIILARESNGENPDGKPKQKTENELSVADARLVDVKADQEELQKGRDRNRLIDEGKLQEARDATRAAIDAAKKDAIELAKIRSENEKLMRARDEAVAARDEAVKEYTRKAEQNKVDYEKRLDEMNSQAMREQARNFNIAGVIGLALFGLGLGLGGLPGLQRTWPFGVIALLCFGLAQLVSQWWFMWACLTAILLAVIAAVVWVIVHHRAGTLQKDTEEKAAQLKSVLGSLVPVLDKAYSEAEQTGKDLLDKYVFGPLGKSMDRGEKSLIHSIRSELESTSSASS